MIYIFHVPVEKKIVSTPIMRQSKTLDEQSMNAVQKSLQPVFSIANCRKYGEQWLSKTVSNYFWSMFVDNIDVFNYCCLSGVNSLYAL